LLKRTLSIQRWSFYYKLWDAYLDDWIVSKKTDDNIYLKGIVFTRGKFMIDWQSRMRLTIENLLMSVGTIRTINERTISQENPEDEWLVKLIHDESSNTTLGGAWSCLVSNESRNHRGQPTINIAFTIEWMAGTLMSRILGGDSYSNFPHIKDKNFLSPYICQIDLYSFLEGGRFATMPHTCDILIHRLLWLSLFYCFAC